MATIDGLSTFDYLDQQNIPKYGESDIISSLQDGISIFESLAMMDSKTFDKNQIKYDDTDSYQSYSNFKKVLAGLKEFYKRMHGYDENTSQEQVEFFEVFGCLDMLAERLKTMKKDIEQCSIKQVNQKSFVNIENLLLMLQMMLGIAVNCDISEQIVGSFTEKLNEFVLDNLMQITKDILPRFCKKDFADLDVSQITGDS